MSLVGCRCSPVPMISGSRRTLGTCAVVLLDLSEDEDKTMARPVDQR